MKQKTAEFLSSDPPLSLSQSSANFLKTSSHNQRRLWGPVS